jgi:hypothetical protein
MTFEEKFYNPDITDNDLIDKASTLFTLTAARIYKGVNIHGSIIH